MSWILETPGVVASETGRAQTDWRGGDTARAGLEAHSVPCDGAFFEVDSGRVTGSCWEAAPERVRAPYRTATAGSELCSLSTTGHGKSCGKQGGPPSKAKYSLATDRERVP